MKDSNADGAVAEALRVINGSDDKAVQVAKSEIDVPVAIKERNQESACPKARNLLHGSIVGDSGRSALCVEADFVTCTQ